ncbi:FUN14 domain-containing protein [Deinococcus sp. KNUC1210]|uniref:FUN14 domain-containing protein n=1 Tax=Deinococcus sp. KNUC1210 TaxID=2917691 RepID=UPI001EEFA583|nr:FUN14 domain-containing protein [Deinococcus sp. KNUC1210]ULH14421.1 FUN14 domain-containing protein [Deinococcus sp. KNUC1210]
MSPSTPAPPDSSLLASLTPLLPSLSLGAVLGFCAGYAIKRLGRMTALIVGLLFLALQLMAWQGLLTINWARIQVLAEPWLHQGGEELSRWGLRILQTNLPFGGAFVAALLVGLRTR